MASEKQQQDTGAFIIAALIALLLYLLSKGNPFLHESVSAGIVTGANTILPDPTTGAPQFDTRIPASVPANVGTAVPPIDSSGALNWNPSDPRTASCPGGYTLWRNVTDGTYQCLQN